MVPSKGLVRTIKHATIAGMLTSCTSVLPVPSLRTVTVSGVSHKTCDLYQLPPLLTQMLGKEGFFAEHGMLTLLPEKIFTTNVAEKEKVALLQTVIIEIETLQKETEQLLHDTTEVDKRVLQEKIQRNVLEVLNRCYVHIQKMYPQLPLCVDDSVESPRPLVKTVVKSFFTMLGLELVVGNNAVIWRDTTLEYTQLIVQKIPCTMLLEYTQNGFRKHLLKCSTNEEGIDEAELLTHYVQDLKNVVGEDQDIFLPRTIQLYRTKILASTLPLSGYFEEERIVLLQDTVVDPYLEQGTLVHEYTHAMFHNSVLYRDFIQKIQQLGYTDSPAMPLENGTLIQMQELDEALANMLHMRYFLMDSKGESYARAMLENRLAQSTIQSHASYVLLQRELAEMLDIYGTDHGISDRAVLVQVIPMKDLQQMLGSHIKKLYGLAHKYFLYDFPKAHPRNSSK